MNLPLRRLKFIRLYSGRKNIFYDDKSQILLVKNASIK